VDEVRFHGRAGQGILTASRVFAEAAIFDGKYAQSFPDFGPERLGAPIAAFTRIDSQPIEIRSQVYTPNAVAVFEDSLLTKVPVTKGLVTNGKLVVNCTEENTEELKKIGEKAGASTLYLNANRIAMELIGSLTVSTIMLGALAQASGFVSIDSLEKIVRDKFQGSMGETNAKMVRMGFKEVRQL
jgi:pyruvate ferredoxin oxidoreductase gamma subunit/2-oxoisovalerate ferredoxin oxidoreductase gamma subunit